MQEFTHAHNCLGPREALGIIYAHISIGQNWLWGLNSSTMLRNVEEHVEYLVSANYISYECAEWFRLIEN